MKALLFLFVVFLLLLAGLIYCDKSQMQEEIDADPCNHFVIVEKIDDRHKIVEFRGKKYFYSRTYRNNWVVGGEYK